MSLPIERTLQLWPDQAPSAAAEDGFSPTLDLYPVDADRPRGAVLICPGGGYANRSPHEGEPIARRLNREGLHAFVVQYRVYPHRHPAPLLDAARAMRTIRHHAAAWQVDPTRIAVCGFSAGGHLAASLGVHFDLADPLPADPIARHSARPDALILSYPVITAGVFANRGSFDNLLGQDPSPALLNYMSLECQVTDRCPPSFLWHTWDDASVPVENSMLFAQALRAHGVPFELHVYPSGAHGLGLAEQDPHVATWSDLCCAWLQGMGWGS